MKKGLPLRAVLTSVVVVLLLIATAGVGLNATLTTQAALEDSWSQEADSLGARTAAQTALFLANAEPAVLRAEAAADAGLVDTSDPESIRRFATRMLLANPSLTWFTWSGADGSMYGALFEPVDGERQLRRYDQEFHPDGTLKRIWVQDDAGAWTVLEESTSDFDVRTRDHFLAGAEQETGGVWTEPYLWLSHNAPGISYAYPSRDAQGTLRGVWTSDVACGPLSDYLATLSVAETGRVYLLTQQGLVVGHPENEVADGPDVYRAAEHPDPMLADAWKTWEALGRPEGAFPVDHLLASAHTLPADLQVPWVVLTVVPEEELYGVARAQAQRAVLAGALFLLVSVGVGLVFSRHLAGAVETVGSEMDRIARYELSDLALSEESSLFSEINAMGDAHDRMKQGLRSFGRYVPRSLVESLMRSGDEARMGGALREVSVLFVGVLGFDGLVEELAPKELFETLSEALGDIYPCIAGQRGTTSTIRGGEVMAFWGAPERQEDHAVRACRAALALRDAGVKLPLHVGVNTGECIVGNIGAAERFSYGVLGDPVNTAARIKGLNKVYGTRLLVGERTAALVGDALVLRPVDWVRMKGKTVPVLVYELLAAESTPELEAQLATWKRALQAYRERRFDEAIAGFEATPWAEPLAGRARGFVEEPPPEDWDGAVTMNRK